MTMVSDLSKKRVLINQCFLKLLLIFCLYLILGSISSAKPGTSCPDNPRGLRKIGVMASQCPDNPRLLMKDRWHPRPALLHILGTTRIKGTGRNYIRTVVSMAWVLHCLNVIIIIINIVMASQSPDNPGALKDRCHPGQAFLYTLGTSLNKDTGRKSIKTHFRVAWILLCINISASS